MYNTRSVSFISKQMSFISKTSLFFRSGPREQSLIRSALKTFEFLSCLRFVEWDGRAEDYLYIHYSRERPG